MCWQVERATRPDVAVQRICAAMEASAAVAATAETAVAAGNGSDSFTIFLLISCTQVYGKQHFLMNLPRVPCSRFRAINHHGPCLRRAMTTSQQLAPVLAMSAFSFPLSLLTSFAMCELAYAMCRHFSERLSGRKHSKLKSRLSCLK